MTQRKEDGYWSAVQGDFWLRLFSVMSEAVGGPRPLVLKWWGVMNWWRWTSIGVSESRCFDHALKKWWFLHLLGHITFNRNILHRNLLFSRFSRRKNFGLGLEPKQNLNLDIDFLWSLKSEWKWQTLRPSRSLQSTYMVWLCLLAPPSILRTACPESGCPCSQGSRTSRYMGLSPAKPSSVLT